MKLTKINENAELLEKAKEFILPYEEMCVQMASYVRKESENLYLIEDDRIIGVIYAKGSFLHCIPDFNEKSEQILKLIEPIFEEEKIKCINGELEVTNKIKEYLIEKGAEFEQSNYYRLMKMKCGESGDCECKANMPPEKLSCDDEIRRCSDQDDEQLFELQKAYVKEEVAPTGRNVGDNEVRIILRQILKNQVCVAIYSDTEYVAKANTNAIGWNYVQLGGVYTMPLFRRNGYAWHLIYNLCKRIHKTGKNVSLYVKEKNSAAIGLYKRIGFEECGKYEIAYLNTTTSAPNAAIKKSI